jgi:hypothetical protein
MHRLEKNILHHAKQRKDQRELKSKTFDNWLKWLNKKDISISIEHEYFKEHYNNLDTFENNLKSFNDMN